MSISQRPAINERRGAAYPRDGLNPSSDGSPAFISTFRRTGSHRPHRAVPMGITAGPYNGKPEPARPAVGRKRADLCR